MVRLSSLPEQAKEALAVWEVMRRLGLDVRDIGLGAHPGNGHVMVTLTGGPRESQDPFCVLLGPLVDGDISRIVGPWKEACLSVHRGEYANKPGEFQDLLRKSGVFKHHNLTEVILKLAERGYVNLGDARGCIVDRFGVGLKKEDLISLPIPDLKERVGKAGSDDGS